MLNAVIRNSIVVISFKYFKNMLRLRKNYVRAKTRNFKEYTLRVTKA